MSAHVCFNCKHEKMVDGSFDGGVIQCQLDQSYHYFEDYGCDKFDDRSPEPEAPPEPEDDGCLVHCPVCKAGDPQYLVCRVTNGKRETLGCNICTQLLDSLDYYDEGETDDAPDVH